MALATAADGGALSFLETTSGQVLTLFKQVIPANGPPLSFSFAFQRKGTPAAQRNIIALTPPVAGVPFDIQLTTANLIQARAGFGTTNKVRNSIVVPTLNAWVRVVVTHSGISFNSTDFIFYFNGVADAGTDITTGSGAVNALSGFRLLNGNAGLNPLAWLGGPLGIWSRPLSPAEGVALTTGAHPTRFREGLLEVYELNNPVVDEGFFQRMALRSTTVFSVVANPPCEPPVIWPQVLAA